MNGIYYIPSKNLLFNIVLKSCNYHSIHLDVEQCVSAGTGPVRLAYLLELRVVLAEPLL